jgi:hypothetical protein
MILILDLVHLKEARDNHELHIGLRSDLQQSSTGNSNLLNHRPHAVLSIYQALCYLLRARSPSDELIGVYRIYAD